MSFKSYLQQLLGVTLTSSLALGLVLGLAIIVTGGTTAEIDLTLEFKRLDGLWMPFVVPLLLLFLSLLLAPLSFLMSRLILRTNHTATDPGQAPG